MASPPTPPAYLSENEGSRNLIAGILGIVFSTLFFAGRVASRLMIKSSFNASDYTLLIGMILAWVTIAMMIDGQLSLSIELGEVIIIEW